MKYFFILILITACGKKVSDADSQPNDRMGDLRGKYKENIQTAQKNWDQSTGWPDAKDCDGTLWAGLSRAAGADFTQLVLAEYSPGEIHRRPKTSGECYPANSQSTISKDMLAGYMLGMWRSSNSSALNNLFGYGRAHNWILGNPATDVGDVFLTPSGQANLCNAIKKLGGPDQLECHYPDSVGVGSKDSEQHLAVLGILLNGEVNGNISQTALGVLTTLSSNNLNDALFTAAYALYSNGDYSHAIDLLLDDNYVYPTYVRGSDNYKLVHWLFAADLILRYSGGTQLWRTR